MWGIDPTKKCNSITKEERQELNKILKNFTVKIKSLGSIKEAIITSGGVSTKEISPKTMESKILSGLFFVVKLLMLMLTQVDLTCKLPFLPVDLQDITVL